MLDDKKIAVVIPAYNEEQLIESTVNGIPAFIDKIVIVDDCSADETVNRAGSLLLRQPDRIILIEHVVNQGVGGAIASGYIWCRDHDMDIAVVMAGDAQMDPNDLPALLEPLLCDRSDYAKGNRLFSGDAWNLIPKVRYLGNAVMSLLTKIASGYWQVADSQCGYTAINRKALAAIDWAQMYKRYGQPNDLLVRLNVNNFRVRDVPTRPIYNIGEKSGVKPIRMIPRLSLLLLKLFVWRMFQKYIIRDFHPLVFFYLFGFSLSLPGFLLGIWLVIYRIFIGYVSVTSALFAALLIISGLQFLLFAMWFDMDYNLRTNGRSEDRR
ncbi:MAG: glycosyltransferase family 2 protein [Anaerolineales bacterium]|nr:glycosyltransferase family 2 protein [Anaerolineales bacterium]